MVKEKDLNQKDKFTFVVAFIITIIGINGLSIFVLLNTREAIIKIEFQVTKIYH